MGKKKQKRSSKVNKLLAAGIVLAIFFLPIVATASWLDGVITGNDTKKVIKIDDFNPRPADAGKPAPVPFDEPIISVTFDDGWESVYSEGMPILHRYGVKSTQFILANEFNDPAYFSEDQVRSIIEMGHEVSSHTISHSDLTLLNDEQLESELKDSKQLLSSKFPIRNDFASPLGAYSNRTIKEIEKHYRSARNTDADLSSLELVDLNVKRSFNQYNINAFTVRSDTTLEQLKSFIEYAKENKAWIVITYHQIDESGSKYSVSPKTFEEHMKMLYESDIRSAPLGQVIDEIERTSR